MATNIFFRLIMGKKLTFFCLNGDIWTLFLQKCLLSSPINFIVILSKSLNLLGCQSDKKDKFYIKKC